MQFINKKLQNYLICEEDKIKVIPQILGTKRQI